MKLLNLSGTPYEIGKGHGEQAKSEVHYSLDSYEKLFWHEANLRWEQALESAKKHMDFIEKSNSALLEEMDGVAKGASVDFDDILALNARSEIALTSNKRDGCTSLAIMPPLADRAYLGQNWDWRAAQSKSIIITEIAQHNRPTINMITEGGIIGKIGMNSAGLGVCLNALRANVKSEKLPIHLGLREILNASTMAEAESKVDNKKMASAANFLIAQHNGSFRKAVNMEVSPLGDDKKVTDSEYLFHTNHFCSGRLIDTISEKKLNATENSFIRHDRIKQLIAESHSRKEVIDKGRIRRWFADHENGLNAICQHKEEGSSDYTNTITAFSVIMDLANRNMHFMNGQPCYPSESMYLHL